MSRTGFSSCFVPVVSTTSLSTPGPMSADPGIDCPIPKPWGRRTPELILCLHELVAMAAAHGHFMVSGQPQVVLVHVDVGTQNIGANLHNAQRGRAGVVICAGRAPYTVDGRLPGGRNRYTHWIQEQFSQASSVQGYVKWHYELTCRENLHAAVGRAFQVAGTEPAGPVYLTLPREVLMQPLEAPLDAPNRAPASKPPAADPRACPRRRGGSSRPTAR